MASFAYTNFKRALLAGEIDLAAGGDDIRARLVMSNTTYDTEKDFNNPADITTQDIYDGSGYADQALASEAVTADDPNDRGEFDATDIVFSSLGVGTRQAVGLVIYKFVATDADHVLIAFIDTGGFPFDGNGGDITIQWNAEGILQAT